MPDETDWSWWYVKERRKTSGSGKRPQDEVSVQREDSKTGPRNHAYDEEWVCGGCGLGTAVISLVESGIAATSTSLFWPKRDNKAWFVTNMEMNS